MRVLTITLAFTGLAALAACDVDQTQEGELPEVNVSGGQLPEYDVDSTLEVGTKEEQVEVPKIETETTNVTVPTIGIEDDGKE